MSIARCGPSLGTVASWFDKLVPVRDSMTQGGAWTQCSLNRVLDALIESNEPGTENECCALRNWRAALLVFPCRAARMGATEVQVVSCRATSAIIAAGRAAACRATLPTASGAAFDVVFVEVAKAILPVARRFWIRRRRFGEQTAVQRQFGSTMAVGEEADVADAV